MAGQASLLRMIDITPIARPLFWVAFANMWNVTKAINLPVMPVALLIAGQFTLPMLVFAPLVLAMAFSGLIAWRNLNVLNTIAQRGTVLSMVVELSTHLGFIVFAALYGEAVPGGAGPVTSLCCAFGLPLVPAIIAIWRLRRRRIDALGADLPSLVRPPGQDSTGGGLRLPPNHAALGWTLVLAGYLYFVTYILAAPLWPSNFKPGYHGYILGYVFFLYARRQFQPNVDAVLGTDMRAPVLFLRSFRDDKRAVNFGSAKNFFLDYSLESRVSAHFYGVGPFIAVDAPNTRMVALGAARVKLGDAEWKGQVTRWMDASALIVVMVGLTHWVDWELRQIIERGHLAKVVVCFPQVMPKPLARDKRMRTSKRDATARLDLLKVLFAGSAWEAQLAAIQKPEQVRSLVFDRDGGMTVVTARSRSRNAYHLAILVAHGALARAWDRRLPR